MNTRRLTNLFFSLLCASLLLIQVTPIAFAQQSSAFTALNANQPERYPQATSPYSDAWPMYGHDAAHTGRSPANGPNNPNIKWTWDASGSVGSPVVGTDGSIYVKIFLDTYHQQVVGLNPEGTVRWTLETLNGQYYYPTIGIDGNIYVILNPQSTDDSLLALNPVNGALIWSFDLGRSSIGSGLTWENNSRPLVGPDGTIYVASALGTAGYGTIFAINPDGTQKWSWDTSADDLYCNGQINLIYCSIESTPALAPNEILYFKPYGQGVIALNSTTGGYLWRNNFDEGSGGADPFGQTLSVGSDSIAYTSEGNGRYNFYAVNPDNTIKWVTETAQWNDQAISPISTDGTLVLRGDNGANFYAFNTSDGTNRWQLPELTPGAYISGAPVLSANGIIYFTTGEATGTPAGTPGYLFAVRVDTGEIIWQYEVGFPDADLAMGPDGTLYVPGESTEVGSALYAFQCPDGVCALPEPTCPNPANITTEEDLSNCIQLANIVPGSQTLGLGADITLHTHLPNIISETVLNGNGHFVSGNNTVPVFQVNNPGNLTLNAITVQNGWNDFTDPNDDAGSRYAGLGYGGGLYNNMGSVLVSNSVISDNSVNYGWFGGGGGIYNTGTMTVVNSTFSGNSASSPWGGGEISGGDGGGIYNTGILTVVNSTFSGNSVIDSFGNGGGIYNEGVLHLKNSILANSTGGDDCTSTVTLASDIRNLIEDTWGFACGSPFSEADPQLGPLENNGGLTKTFALLAGSPALDAGSDAVCVAAPVSGLDQRGVTRPQGAHCDIGAFETEFYTLTINSAHGTVTKNPDRDTYHEGDVVQLTATPTAGWSFANWTGDLTGTANPGSVTIHGNTTVTANYTQNEYTLTITSAHGTVVKSPNQATYHYGDVVQFAATPNTGWSFANWTGDLSSGVNPASITIHGNTSVTANYTQNEYTLAITSVHGTVVANPNQATYHEGDVVQLIATPNAGWSFVSWTGDLISSVNPVSVTIHGNTSVMANYTRNEFTLFLPLTLR